MKKETRELTCINCPLGCAISVELFDGEITSITGNTCPRGKAYAQKEVTNPTRILTTTVPVIGGNRRMVSVKTSADVPKDKIFACVGAVKDIKVQAPVLAGAVILKNAADTGIDIIATANVQRIKN